MVNLPWLKTFCALVETGHFTRTAEKLAMTQPGVSQHIRKLEDYYGRVLLNRRGKQFDLTDAGQQVYRQARQALAMLGELDRGVRTDSPWEGVIRIASPGSLGLKLYPALLDYQRAHPELSMDYVFAPNDSVEQSLVENRRDLGFVTRTSTRSELSCVPIGSEPLLLATPAGVESVTWETLERLGFINHPDGAHHASLLLGANFPCFEQISQFPQRGFSNQIGLILEPVSRGLGFTVLPAHAVAAFPRQTSIAVHHLSNPVSETLYLLKRRFHPVPRRVEMIIDHIGSLLADKME